MRHVETARDLEIGAVLYGLIAEYDRDTTLVEAAKHAKDAGYRRMDAFLPFPIEGLEDALDNHERRLQWLIFGAGLTGAASGYGLQYWVNLYAYPLNIGGRSLHSWPAFIPITFECTILFAGLTAVFGMLALNRLPRLYHPVFNHPRFAHASQDRFFLCIEATDSKFNREGTRSFLESTGAVAVSEVAD